MERIIIERYGTPTKLDSLPLGSICKVINHQHNEYSLYIQTSKSDEASWDFLGMFNSSTPQDYINNLLVDRLEIE